MPQPLPLRACRPECSFLVSRPPRQSTSALVSTSPNVSPRVQTLVLLSCSPGFQPVPWQKLVVYCLRLLLFIGFKADWPRSTPYPLCAKCLPSVLRAVSTYVMGFTLLTIFASVSSSASPGTSARVSNLPPLPIN